MYIQSLRGGGNGVKYYIRREYFLNVYCYSAAAEVLTLFYFNSALGLEKKPLWLDVYKHSKMCL